MDDMVYQYPKDANGNITNNRLRYVYDGMNAGNYSNDIDNQTALCLTAVRAERAAESASDNYAYDAIGNLIKDVKGGITRVTWTAVYGKIKTITKSDGTTITYGYDPAGNRISKAVTINNITVTTWYVRDAQGNTLAVYNENAGTLKLTEQDIYGSSRLGIWNRNVDADQAVDPVVVNAIRGNKNYELTNHLGNVLVTLSDVRKQVVQNNVITGYTPVVVSASDYYSFGMQQPGRTVSASGYRYGFNGQEKDNEIAGEGNDYTATFWEYDSRLGKRWNVDPLTHKFPWQSPYSGLDNNPIYKTDPTGAGTESTHLDKAGKVVAVFDDGDKGVYQHGDNADGKAPTENQIKLRQTIYKSTSANGTKIGETWTSLGFADFDIYEKTGKVTPIAGARIDIGSTWATSKVNEILDADPDPVTYGIKARGNGPWDIKTHVPEGETWGYGSLLYGKYASARDAGNISAGMVTERSTLPNMVFDYGFGAYNKAGNSMIGTLKRITKDVLLMSSTNIGAKMHGLSSVINTSVNGEDKLSKQGQEVGKTMLPYYTPPPPPTKPEAPPYWQY